MSRNVKFFVYLILISLITTSASFAGSITNVSLALSPGNEAGTNTNFELSFDIESDLPVDGKIRVSLENATGLDVTSATCKFDGMSGVGGFDTEWAFENDLVFKRDGSASVIPGGSTISVKFGPIRLPDNGGTYTLETVATRAVGVQDPIDSIDNPATYTVITIPSAAISNISPNPAVLGDAVTVQATGTDPDNDQVQVRIDWDDGNTSAYSSLQASGSTFSFTHTYTGTGDYAVVVRAKDSGGNESAWLSEETITIVANTAPTTEIVSATPNPVETQKAVTLEINATDAENDNVAIIVDWGDGRVVDLNDFKASGSKFTASASYTTPNTYTIRTRAKDSRGLLGDWTDSFDITVEKPNSAPEAIILDVIPSSAAVGETVTVRAWAVDEDDDKVQMRISWQGSDISDYTGLEPNRSEFTFTHVYSEVGTYDITVVAKDEHDLRGNWSQKVFMRVTNNPPLITNLDDFQFQNTEPFGIDLDTCLIPRGYEPETFNWEITPEDTNLHVVMHNRGAVFFAPDWEGVTPVEIFVNHPSGMKDSLVVNVTVTAPETRQNYRIATYNLTSFSDMFSEQQYQLYQTVIKAIDPDILVAQEIYSQNDVYVFLYNVLEKFAPGVYEAAPFENGNNTETALFYRKQAFKYVSQQPIVSEELGDLVEYSLGYVFDPMMSEIKIYAAQFQEGDDATAIEARHAKATLLRQELDKLPKSTNFFICGNLNILDSAEPAFQVLTQNAVDTSALASDPLNLNGAWSGNADFAPYHTNLTRITASEFDTTGGLVDRLDYILISEALYDSAEILYLDSSYVTFGNDGRHFEQPVNNPINWNVLASIADALNAASEHLPVYLDFKVDHVNRAPQITSAANVNAYELSPFKYTATAIDPNSDPLILSFSNYPVWLDTSGTTISGTPVEGALDSSFVVIATDGELSDTLLVAIKMFQKNDPPSIVSPDSATAHEGELFTYTARAIDEESQDLAYLFRNYPGWLSPSDSTISGIPTDAATDTSFLLIAYDGDLMDSLIVQIKVILKNKAPHLTSPFASTAVVDSFFQYTASAIDPEGTPLAFSFIDYPYWLSVSDSILSGTVPRNAVDSSFVVIASDGELSDSLKVDINVVATNHAPEITSPDTTEALEDTLFRYLATARDPENTRVSFKFIRYPKWMTPGDSTIFGKPTEGKGDTSFVVIATDGNLSDSMKVFVKVIAVNDPPKISGLTGITMGHDETGVINLNGKASDPDNSVDALTWSVTSLHPNLTALLSQQLVQLTVTGYVDSAEVKVKVTDPAGAADSINVMVKVTYPAGVDKETAALPTEFSLGQNYPNPFNPETTIRYALPKEAHVKIVVFDLQGRQVAELWHGKQKAGYHSLRWNGSSVSSGMYFIQMRTSEFVQTRKCVLIK